MLDLAPIEQNVARQAVQARRPLPSNIKNAPELRIGLQLYLQAFFDLDSERSHAFSLVRIPSSKIRQYAREFELNEEQCDSLQFFVEQMDGSHLKRLKDRQDKSNG